MAQLTVQREMTWQPLKGLLNNWLAILRAGFTRPACPGKPSSVHIPERLWRRHGAVYMSLYEGERHNRDE
ncbi:MAG: hypothetical protein ABW146_13465 [Candidatus Sedimenticola sp. 6PFRAG7]